MTLLRPCAAGTHGTLFGANATRGKALKRQDTEKALWLSANVDELQCLLWDQKWHGTCIPSLDSFQLYPQKEWLALKRTYLSNVSVFDISRPFGGTIHEFMPFQVLLNNATPNSIPRAV